MKRTLSGLWSNCCLDRSTPCTVTRLKHILLQCPPGAAASRFSLFPCKVRQAWRQQWFCWWGQTKKIHWLVEKCWVSDLISLFRRVYFNIYFVRLSSFCAESQNMWNQWGEDSVKLLLHLGHPFRVFCARLPEADAFPGTSRPHPQEDDAQTEATPGETPNTAAAVKSSTSAEQALLSAVYCFSFTALILRSRVNYLLIS